MSIIQCRCINLGKEGCKECWKTVEDGLKKFNLPKPGYSHPMPKIEPYCGDSKEFILWVKGFCDAVGENITQEQWVIFKNKIKSEIL